MKFFHNKRPVLDPNIWVEEVNNHPGTTYYRFMGLNYEGKPIILYYMMGVTFKKIFQNQTK